MDTASQGGERESFLEIEGDNGRLFGLKGIFPPGTGRVKHVQNVHYRRNISGGQRIVGKAIDVAQLLLAGLTATSEPRMGLEYKPEHGRSSSS